MFVCKDFKGDSKWLQTEMWDIVGKQGKDKIAQRYQNKCMKETKVRGIVEMYVQTQEAWKVPGDLQMPERLSAMTQMTQNAHSSENIRVSALPGWLIHFHSQKFFCLS